MAECLKVLTQKILEAVDAVCYILVCFNQHCSPSPCLLAASVVALDAAVLSVTSIITGESSVRGFMATTTGQVGDSDERRIVFFALLENTC